MRGADLRQDQLFSCVSSENRIPRTHPLRGVRVVVHAILDTMSDQFEPLYSDTGGRVLETVDEPALQLVEIVKRRNAAAKVSEQSLQEYRTGVLAALDAAALWIKKNYGE